MLVNDEFKINTYSLDTSESIKNRIAVNLDTLPKYLYSKEKITPSLKIITIKDLLKKIKKSKKDIVELIEEMKEYNIDKKDVITPWLLFNKSLQDEETADLLFLNVLDTLKTFNIISEDKELESIWKDREKGRKKFNDSIEELKKSTEKYENIYKEFEKISVEFIYSDYRIEKTSLQLYLNLDVSILEIFNNIILNNEVPFSSCEEYFKILRDFIPPDDWNNITPNIILKVNDKINISRNDLSDYVDVLIQKRERYIVDMNIVSERGYLDKDSFIKRALSCFKEPPVITDEKETSVLGIYNYPDRELNSYVFSDLVMNNPVFSELMVIDESTKATKRRGESSKPWLYVHFNHPATGEITCSIIQKVGNLSDPDMKDLDTKLFPHGKPYLRLRVKAEDKEKVKNFQKIFTKLLSIYDQKYKEIMEYYTYFIPSFDKEEKIEVPLKKTQQEIIAPEVFVTNYSRKCADYRMPIIVEEEDLDKYEEKRVVKFPRDYKEGSYPSDGKKQHYYVCVNDEYPYPGLQENKLSNSEDYPFVPCCFKTEQNKKGSLFRNYYYDEKVESRSKKQQELIVTDKFLDLNKYGVLSTTTKELLELLDGDRDYTYIRCGVNRGFSSFLHCVLLGTENLQTTDKKYISEKLKSERKILSSKNIYPLCKQCSYDIDNKSLIKNIKDINTYLDPKLYVQFIRKLLQV